MNLLTNKHHVRYHSSTLHDIFSVPPNLVTQLNNVMFQRRTLTNDLIVAKMDSTRGSGSFHLLANQRGVYTQPPQWFSCDSCPLSISTIMFSVYTTTTLVDQWICPQQLSLPVVYRLWTNVDNVEVIKIQISNQNPHIKFSQSCTKCTHCRQVNIFQLELNDGVITICVPFASNFLTRLVKVEVVIGL